MILYSLIFIEIITTTSNKCKKGELTIPNDTKIIENNEYEGCKEFSGSLIIPNSVEKISKYAFYGCSGFNGSLTISENIKEIEDYAFGETNFESINFLAENIKCSSNAFTNVPKKITVKDNYKDDYICGIQIRKPESKSWFKKNLMLVLCIAIPVIIITIIVIVASCMKKTYYEDKNLTTNQYDISSNNTINETKSTYNCENPRINTIVRERSTFNKYNNQIQSRHWSDDESNESLSYKSNSDLNESVDSKSDTDVTKSIDSKSGTDVAESVDTKSNNDLIKSINSKSGTDVAESVDAKSNNDLIESINSLSDNVPQIKHKDQQSTVEEISPLSIHEFGSDSSLSSSSE